MKKQNLWKAVPMALATLTLLSSCGQKTFQKQDFTTSGSAAAYLYIKPKLDLVIFQDNSDSFGNAMAQVKPQLSSFLAGLDTNWDYHVVVLPLQSQMSISSKTVLATDCSSVTGAGSCVSASNVNYFNSMAGDGGWINSVNTSIGNTDLGFYNMVNNIYGLQNAHYLRSDAALAITVITNGEDQSGVTYVSRPDGTTGMGVDYNSTTTIQSFYNYLAIFQTFQKSLSINKFYAVAAGGRYTDCYGGGATWQGKRYMDMASSLGGASFDLCSNAFPNVLSNLQSSLKTIVQAFEFNYVVLDSQPDPSTIVFTKNGATIPNDSLNGWTYAGYLTNQPTADAPTSGYVRTGYMIRLNGSAKLTGSDTYTVTYNKF